MKPVFVSLVAFLAAFAALPANAAGLQEGLRKTANAIHKQEQGLASITQNLRGLEEEERTITQSMTPRLAESERMMQNLLAAPAMPPFWLAELSELAEGAALAGRALDRLRLLLAGLQHDRQQILSLREEAQKGARLLLARREELALAYGQLRTMLAERPKTRRQAKARKEAANADSLEALLTLLAGERPDSSAVPPARSEGPVLFPPIAGVTRQGFGEKNRFGEKKAGLGWEGLAGALVTAPAAAKVLYAAPFRNYAQILILDIGENYHIVLTGLDRLEVKTGADIFAGQPLGWLASAKGEAKIYMELRHLSQPIDPAPFMRLALWEGEQG